MHSPSTTPATPSDPAAASTPAAHRGWKRYRWALAVGALIVVLLPLQWRGGTARPDGPARWRVAEPATAIGQLAGELLAAGAVVAVAPDGEHFWLEVKSEVEGVSRVNERLARIGLALDGDGRLVAKVSR